MKKTSRIYANELIIIGGFIGLLTVSYLYAKLEIKDESLFWSAVLPSAFVDIISLVISTILITKLIERKRIYDRKSKMYKIINIPHDKMVYRIVWDYKYIITATPNEKFKRILQEDIDLTNIREYFKENVKENFQQDEILIDETIKRLDDEGFANEIQISSTYSRIQLLEEYQVSTIKFINDFIEEYSYVSTTDYLALLVEIKEYLRGDNPLWIYYFEGSLGACVIDVDKYINSNQRYLDKVVKLKSYFIGIDVENDNSENDYVSVWKLIGFSIVLGMIIIIYINVMGFFLGF